MVPRFFSLIQSTLTVRIRRQLIIPFRTFFFFSWPFPRKQFLASGFGVGLTRQTKERMTDKRARTEHKIIASVWFGDSKRGTRSIMEILDFFHEPRVRQWVTRE